MSDDIGLKHWIGRIVFMTVLMLGLAYLVDYFFHFEIFVMAIIASTIVVILGFLHEGLHYIKAVKLGHKPEWYRGTIKYGFDIEWGDTKRKVMRVHDKQIRQYPYIFIIPISLLLLVAGYFTGLYALIFAGGGSLLIHLVMYPLEGKSV